MTDDKKFEEMLMGLREGYNDPPETPREEMWVAIQARLGEERAGEEEPGIVSMEARRNAPLSRIPKPLSWTMAAAAVLILGLGIGRMTAPVTPPETGGERTAATSADPTILRAAAVEHLVRTESLLTLVRADARAGRVEPNVGSWARQLLSQTRLLMDASSQSDPVMEDLLGDLELVLVQIVGVANAAPGDRARIQSELNLAMDGLEEREVLPRIQAFVPAGPGYFGT